MKKGTHIGRCVILAVIRSVLDGHFFASILLHEEVLSIPSHRTILEHEDGSVIVNHVSGTEGGICTVGYLDIWPNIGLIGADCKKFHIGVNMSIYFVLEVTTENYISYLIQWRKL